jgi:hypothetical protein
MKYLKLAEKAKAVLDTNWTGSYTRPSEGLYPYQWSWDSAFISFAYAHYDENRAQQELLSLFKGQWSNGLLPHIVFHQEAKDYSPGPELWKSEQCPHAPPSPRTSGIVQPPIHSTAALHIYRKASDSKKALDFLRKLFPKLKAWHEYLYRERDPFSEGLVYIRHPWESGQDNSPIWDQALESIHFSPQEIPEYKRTDTKFVDLEYRPTDAEYDRYVYLIKLFYERNYDEEKIYKDSPFLIQDVLFNALLCRANQHLAEIARILNEDPGHFESWTKKTAAAINTKLWNDEHAIYFDYDMKKEKLIEAHVASGFTPLYAHIPDENRAQRMGENLNTHCFCHLSKGSAAIPSYDEQQPGYSPSGYWRGPIWINLNWLIYRGLESYNLNQYASYVRSAIIELPKRYGFCEYYDAEVGRCLGAKNFSWSAALALDVLYD